MTQIYLRILLSSFLSFTIAGKFGKVKSPCSASTQCPGLSVCIRQTCQCPTPLYRAVGGDCQTVTYNKLSIVPSIKTTVIYAVPGSSCGPKSVCTGGSFCDKGECCCPSGYIISGPTCTVGLDFQGFNQPQADAFGFDNQLSSVDNSEEADSYQQGYEGFDNGGYNSMANGVDDSSDDEFGYDPAVKNILGKLSFGSKMGNNVAPPSSQSFGCGGGNGCQGGQICVANSCCCPPGLALGPRGVCLPKPKRGQMLPQVHPGGFCSPAHECTGGSVCKRGVCCCPGKLVQVGESCVLPPSAQPSLPIIIKTTIVSLGLPCQSTSQCVAGAVCSGTCKCAPGFRVVASTCLPRRQAREISQGGREQ